MHRMAPHIHGLMLRQIGLQKNVLNRNPSLEQQLMSGSEMAVLLCGPLEKESSPYLVVWRGNKKKVSEGKEQKSTEILTERLHPTAAPQTLPSHPCSVPALVSAPAAPLPP